MAEIKIFFNGLLLFFFCICLSGCNEKVTNYSPDEGEVQSANLDKDSTKAVTFFVHVQNDSLAVTAAAEVYTKFGEIGYYKYIDINLAGFGQDTSRMDVSLTADDRSQSFQFAKSDWASAIRQLVAMENIADTLAVVLICERKYRLASLPDKLQLNYRIATEDTVVSGSTSFKAVITKNPGILRWH